MVAIAEYDIKMKYYYEAYNQSQLEWPKSMIFDKRMPTPVLLYSRV